MVISVAHDLEQSRSVRYREGHFMATAGARAGSARVDAPTILLVEDVPEAREQASKSLRKHGYAVEEAGDGGQAVRRAARRLPDLVVMDLSLPIMDGIEAIRRIRAMAAS